MELIQFKQIARHVDVVSGVWYCEADLSFGRKGWLHLQIDWRYGKRNGLTMKVWKGSLACLSFVVAASAATPGDFDEVLARGSREDRVLLAKRYYDGMTLGRDFTKAARLFYSAAGEGDPEAQYWISKMYSDGSGLTRRPDKAFVWALAGSKKNHPGCQNLLGVYYSHGIGVESNQAVAVTWFRKAAEQGNANAQFNLGSCYEFETGVERDMDQAVAWYEKAAQGGCALAQSSLGSCHEYGIGVPVDSGLAAFWYRKAAESGDAVGMLRLGSCYEAGRGVPKDLKSAAALYGQAAAAGNPKAQFLYGACFERGKGVALDEGAARDWYRKAVEQGVDEARQRLSYLNDDAAAASARADERKQSGLVIRGLYLGMPIQDAAITLEKQLRDSGRDVMITVFGEEQQRKILSGNEVEIFADRSGNVVSFYFSDKIVRELFHHGSASKDDVMRTFMKTYGPANSILSQESQAIIFKGRQIGIQTIHVYRSAQGYELAFFDSYVVQNTMLDADPQRLSRCKPIGSMLLRNVTAE